MHFTTTSNSKLGIKQFAEVSGKRHAEYNTGRLDAKIQYWRKEFATPPSPLPLLTLAKVTKRPILKKWENVRAFCRVSAECKAQILKLCRRLRTTPFHFYIAILRALLLRYTIGGEDVTIRLAENGRGHDIKDLDVMGPLYNVVPVLPFSDV